MDLWDPFELAWPRGYKTCSCSTQLSMKFILLINVKMPTIVGILTFIGMIKQHLRDLEHETSSFVGILIFMSNCNFVLSELSMKKVL